MLKLCAATAESFPVPHSATTPTAHLETAESQGQALPLWALLIAVPQGVGAVDLIIRHTRKQCTDLATDPRLHSPPPPENITCTHRNNPSCLSTSGPATLSFHRHRDVLSDCAFGARSEHVSVCRPITLQRLHVGSSKCRDRDEAKLDPRPLRYIYQEPR